MSIRNFANYKPILAKTAYIDSMAVVIGQVTVGEYSSLWPMTVARGDINSITIGERTNIQDGSILHVTHDSEYCLGGKALIIGDYVTVGHQVNLHACTIEHHCLIGIGSIVLDGAKIPPYTLLGAGSIVSPNKVLEGGYLWYGNPVKKIRPLTDKELEFLEYSANYYSQLAQQHITSES
ncbi:MAG: gamma carbonic anhydrase family protein [Thiomargarita sp.]|nr:gamma carbonic anhydrase family protein [Thiomargarita sp.]